MNHKNNFDFLRLAAAFSVLFAHQHALLGQAEPSIGNRIGLGQLSVAVFFTISGYLVAQSWERDPHIARFAGKRLLRVWPGLAAVTLLSALVLGPIVSTLPLRDYIADPRFAHYMANLRFAITYELPGVFERNPFPNAVNGSTWTIPLEIRCYLYLCLVGAIGLLRKRLITLSVVVALVAYHFAWYRAETNPAINHGRDFGLYFCAGVLMWIYRDAWERRKVAGAVAACLLGAVAIAFGQYKLGELIAVSSLTIAIGSSSTPVIREAGRFGDLSYGIYVYAFVVQQTLISALGAGLPFSAHLAIASAITTVFAWLSWHLIEKPALSMKRFISPRRRRAPTPINHEATAAAGMAHSQQG
ncbi:acyltransferase family protein [Burkholderia vietnamiensis]|uniref:acyltransferase family protein n=1 Tax=Burkholderia vietnamiensis TaxID=60552 RepID=UPI001B94CE39|nr:acyltransferase [Burkholderia vietnamiensis]MBR8055653.1 acyltransferase [Burkholderia vietnamiensis]